MVKLSFADVIHPFLSIFYIVTWFRFEFKPYLCIAQTKDQSEWNDQTFGPIKDKIFQIYNEKHEFRGTFGIAISEYIKLL